MDQRANYSPQAAAGKSIIWRIIGVFYLFTIALITTGSFPQSSIITVIHHSVFLLVFYLQDRAWTRIEWGKEYPFGLPTYWIPTKTRSLVKGFVYEILIAIPIMLVIGWLVTGNIHHTVTITFTYTFSKIILYQVYEQVYDKKVIHFITF